MKKSTVLSLAIIVLSACSSHRYLTSEIPTATHHDTVYIGHQRHDSIFISQSHASDYRLGNDTLHRVDTLIIRDSETQFRYHLIHDTLREIKKDSIPVIITQTEIKEVSRTPWYIRFFFCIGVASVGYLLIMIRKR